jgi:hypothetical protein
MYLPTAMLNHLEYILVNFAKILKHEHEGFNSRVQLLTWGPCSNLVTPISMKGLFGTAQLH